MWVVFTEDISDDTCGLAVLAGGTDSTVVHRVEDASVDRLQTVARIRQGTRYDDGHSIVEVACLHDVDDGLLLIAVVADRSGAGRCLDSQ